MKVVVGRVFEAGGNRNVGCAAGAVIVTARVVVKIVETQGESRLRIWVVDPAAVGGCVVSDDGITQSHHSATVGAGEDAPAQIGRIAIDGIMLQQGITAAVVVNTAPTC